MLLHCLIVAKRLLCNVKHNTLAVISDEFIKLCEEIIKNMTQTDFIIDISTVYRAQRILDSLTSQKLLLMFSDYNEMTGLSENVATILNIRININVAKNAL